MTTTETEQIVLEDFDPDDLLSDRNIRFDTAATVDADFTASIKEFGNIEPITVVRTAEGLRIRTGHRRAAACKLAGQPVRGFIIGTDDDTTADQVTRLYQQFSENHHRTGITQLETAAVVAALFDLGQTETGIAKKTRMSKDQVKAARKVSGSELAAKAAERYDLNLMQAAVIADFGTDDVQAVTALVKTARDDPAQFDHVAQQYRDSAAERAQKAALTAELAAAGYQVTDEWQGVNRNGWHNLRNWLNADGTDITRESHATCPHRAVRIEQELTWPTEAEAAWRADPAHAEYIAELREADDLGPDEQPEIEFDNDDEAVAAGHVITWVAGTEYCADPAAAGHQDRYPAGRYTSQPAKPEPGTAEAEKVKEERRALLRRNRDWRSATETRTAHLKALLGRKELKPKALADAALLLIADAVARGEAAPEKMGEGHQLACQLLGLTGPDAAYGGRDVITAALAKATPARRLVITLGMILAATEGEDGTGGCCADVHTWQRADTPRLEYGNSAFHSGPARTARYLTWLETETGYPLTELETWAAHGKPATPPAGADSDPDNPEGDDTGTAAGPVSGDEADSGTAPDATGPVADVAPPAGEVDTGGGVTGAQPQLNPGDPAHDFSGEDGGCTGCGRAFGETTGPLCTRPAHSEPSGMNGQATETGLTVEDLPDGDDEPDDAGYAGYDAESSTR